MSKNKMNSQVRMFRGITIGVGVLLFTMFSSLACINSQNVSTNYNCCEPDQSIDASLYIKSEQFAASEISTIEKAGFFGPKKLNKLTISYCCNSNSNKYFRSQKDIEIDYSLTPLQAKFEVMKKMNELREQVIKEVATIEEVNNIIKLMNAKIPYKEKMNAVSQSMHINNMIDTLEAIKKFQK